MWISNPFVSPYFGPLLAVTAGILGGALLLLLALARGNPARLRRNVLFQRWRVWTIITPIYGLAVLAGALPTLLLLSALVFQGLREYAALVGLPRPYRRVLLALGLLAAPVALLSAAAFQGLPALLLLAGTLQPLLLRKQGGAVRHLAFAVLGWGYVAWFLAHLMLLYRYTDGGPGILLALGLGIALSDIGAFVVGKRLGRHPLAPTLSPHKTWEGVLGNVAGAYLGIGLLAFALPGDFRGWLLAGLPLVVALGAVWGDLLESSIKREFAAKDAGAWLPGFGGLLDRIDSLILVGPLVFYFLRLAGN
jgi:phosphatidate cytidylyltransferase